MKYALLTLVLLGGGCGGRDHLQDNTGADFRRTMAAQRGAHPRKSVAPATADEVKLATANRMLRLSASASGGVTASTGGYTSSAGQPSTISAASVNLGAPPAGDARMQAK